MKEEKHQGVEQRHFLRVDFVKPLDYKVCKKETISKLLNGYTANISESGILCNLKTKVDKEDILWLSFDRSTLDVFFGIEKRCLIYQGGVIGKVVRIEHKHDGSCDTGIQFLTREEHDTTHIVSSLFLNEKIE